jgi:hypothetical protein
VLLLQSLTRRQAKEGFYFYNIRPTEQIDPTYYNYNEDPHNYYNHKRVGDIHGVDLNCNNVNLYDLLRWLDQDEPTLLYDYVYRYDPSINVFNPIHAPRIFKMLLRNLPQKHKYIPILRKCLYRDVRIA